MRVIPFSPSPSELPSVALASITATLRRPPPDRALTGYEVLPQIGADDPDMDDSMIDGAASVFLFANYMWTRDANLARSRAAKAANPDHITIHGGPHTPHYEADALQFMADNPHIDVCVRREGELTALAVLEALNAESGPEARDRLGDVPGLVFRSSNGSIVRTEDPARIDDLGQLPSPFLSGELDHLDPAGWLFGVMETNRGCPYGCTFCDWGQATLSRVRQFPLERVLAEIDWMAEHQVRFVWLADANFGMMRRDVEIAEHIAAVRERSGFPHQVTATFTKNTNRHVREIVRCWVEAGMWTEGFLSLQTVDEATLVTVRRENIRTERYEELAREFHDLDLPVASDVILGLPGATVESFKTDLQYFFDLRMGVRLFEALLLPNSPMNEPSYREEHAIEVDEDDIIVATSTYTREHWEEMQRMRYWYRSLEDLGLLRIMLRFLQHDHGLRALEVIHQIDRSVRAEPARYPLLAFVGRHLDQVNVPPGGWPPFYDEVRELLHLEFAVPDRSDLNAVVEAEIALRPDRGRTFPARVELEHDVVRYHHEVIEAAPDQRPALDLRLADYRPGTLTIADPDRICVTSIREGAISGRRSRLGDNQFWWDLSWELESPLSRPLARVVPH